MRKTKVAAEAEFFPPQFGFRPISDSLVSSVGRGCDVALGLCESNAAASSSFSCFWSSSLAQHETMTCTVELRSSLLGECWQIAERSGCAYVILGVSPLYRATAKEEGSFVFRHPWGQPEELSVFTSSSRDTGFVPIVPRWRLPHIPAVTVTDPVSAARLAAHQPQDAAAQPNVLALLHPPMLVCSVARRLSAEGGQSRGNIAMFAHAAGISRPGVPFACCIPATLRAAEFSRHP